MEEEEEVNFFGFGGCLLAELRQRSCWIRGRMFDLAFVFWLVGVRGDCRYLSCGRGRKNEVMTRRGGGVSDWQSLSLRAR